VITSGIESQLIAVSFIAIHLENIFVGVGFSRVLPLLVCLFCSFRSSFQNSACSFQKQRKCRYSNFPLFIGISAVQPPKNALNIKLFGKYKLARNRLQKSLNNH
ncbi:MAG: hypothetical protein PUJ59_04375, partial [Clostridiaceae bacterium]|nr:hypothetical protein [Clostridiaceae bacterium]MDY5890045.1 hypothetical protein [Oscillospiraceae bacterium]